MKKSIPMIVFLAAVFCLRAAAQDRTFGVGVIIGEPTGLSVKKWTGPKTALVGGAAWSFIEPQSLHLHLDYLFHDFRVFRVRKGRMALYYGIGGRIRVEDKSHAGIRIPIGIVYVFERAPFDIFAEYVPVFDVVPRTGLTGNGAVGVRIFFD